MQNLNEETIKNLVKLCRIDCSSEEQAALLKDLQSILAYVEQLQEIDTESVPPCNQVIEGMANVMRSDAIGTTMPRELLIENAPSHVGGMIRVPPIIKQS